MVLFVVGDVADAWLVGGYGFGLEWLARDQCEEGSKLCLRNTDVSLGLYRQYNVIAADDCSFAANTSTSQSQQLQSPWLMA